MLQTGGTFLEVAKLARPSRLLHLLATLAPLTVVIPTLAISSGYLGRAQNNLYPGYAVEIAHRQVKQLLKLTQQMVSLAFNIKKPEST